ncbi:LysR family transcriptional regulator [Paraferrimonas haliotis]|uniref:Transcriptional regulator n=1 Tax=Paraferrimonas haliotis TaxID=2013866 RepID=A0AA37TTQ8_9GAMM|nr:LysR family transcriptional regulator [Paraferrimonas haliotis]GLS82794.1 transcriptional regulator [Paraferrimonas haliotis]
MAHPNFDYNLLKVLRVLIETKNTRAAAELLHISQSAVSHSLKRLRDAFDDPLFTRQRHGLIPTQRCLEISQQLPQLKLVLDGLFNQHDRFDPRTLTTEVKIGITSALSHAVGTPLFNRLLMQAPNASFELMDWSWQTEKALLTGELHAAIGFGPLMLSKSVRQHQLPEKPYLICVRDNHPLLAKEQVTLRDIAQYPLIGLRSPDWRASFQTAEDLILREGLEPQVLLKSDSMLTCFSALRQSDGFFPIVSLSTLPDGIKTINLSPGMPSDNKLLYLFYSNELTGSEYHQWLLFEIIEFFNEDEANIKIGNTN